MAHERLTTSEARGAGAWAPGPVLVAAADEGQAGAVGGYAREVARWLGREMAFVRAGGSADIAAGGEPTLQVAGAPARAILETARAVHAAVIAIGAPPVGDHLGATTSAVLRGAPCPVLFVPAGAAPRPGPILLPQDGTPAMAAMGPVATRLAERADAGLEVLHVVCEGCREPGALPVPRHVDQPAHEWAAWRAAFLTRACGCVDERPTLRVRVGRPAEVIRAAAEAVDARLIVLGWRGRLDGRATTLREVVAGTARPVLVFRLAAANPA